MGLLKSRAWKLCCFLCLLTAHMLSRMFQQPGNMVFPGCKLCALCGVLRRMFFEATIGAEYFQQPGNRVLPGCKLRASCGVLCRILFEATTGAEYFQQPGNMVLPGCKLRVLCGVVQLRRMPQQWEI